jgi:N-methylhydantoinase A/oxoprolinase/acetone carboxylase beta subunit
VAGETLVMTSAGGLVPVAAAAEIPAALLLSGPAGGVRAAAAVASACGFPAAVAFDMGGTSTDVCLVRGGVPEPAPARTVAGYPIRLPALAVHTIGAGGGSIARLDAGGALVVGPESAGARPGPACYGLGGVHATVTDADLVLGRIPADAAFAGLGGLDVDEARAALDRAGVDAAGVVAVVDSAMERAVRAVTVEQGVDPRSLALVAFGGAGPLHACAIAGALGMRAVIVPPRAGVLSAVGLLCAPHVRDLVRSWPEPRGRLGLDEARADLARGAAALVCEGAVAGDRDAGVNVETFVDCRYEGQSHELTVPDVLEFPAEHRRRNGYIRTGQPVEVVAIRARASRAADIVLDDLPPVARARVRGPRVVAEADCSVWIPDGWVAQPGPGGAWIVQREDR